MQQGVTGTRSISSLPQCPECRSDARAGTARSHHQRLVPSCSVVSLQVQLEPIRRVSGGAAGQLAPKYTGMLQAVRTIVREEGVLVNAPCSVAAATLPSDVEP